MTLRRIDSFATDNPEKLADQLSRLEDNITSALAAVQDRLVFRDWELIEPYQQLSYGIISRIETTAAGSAVVALLPSVSLETIGQYVGLKRSGSQNLTLFPVESAALIDGAASVALNTDGTYLFIHDGVAWSRV